ncbi:MAG TPA: HDOD domain-containing protein [Rhodocyclaceae bacterium]
MSLFGASKLPPISPFAQELFSLSIEADDAEQRLLRICRSEPELSIRIVAVANSVVYRRGGAEVLEPLQAIRRVGLARTKQLATAMLFGQKLAGYLAPGLAEEIWLHSLTMAAAAQEIAQTKGHPDPSAAYLVGLIHDLGHLVAEVGKAGSIAQAVSSAVTNKLPLDKAEDKEWETNHARQAVELLTLWHAPANIVQVIGEHHQENADPNDLPAFVAGAEEIARFAGIAERVHGGRADPFAPLAIDAQTLSTTLAQRLALKPEQIAVIAKRIVDQVEGFQEAARALAGKR